MPTMGQRLQLLLHLRSPLRHLWPLLWRLWPRLWPRLWLNLQIAKLSFHIPTIRLHSAELLIDISRDSHLQTNLEALLATRTA